MAARNRLETDVVSNPESMSWRVKNSDPSVSMPFRDDSVLSTASHGAKTLKRATTAVSDRSSPRNDALFRRVFELPPQLIARLHRESEERTRVRKPVMRGASIFSSGQPIPLDIWRGGPGSWQILGDLCLSKLSQEPNYHVRGLELVPRSPLISAKSMLRMCGIGVVNSKGCKSEENLLPGQDNFSVCRLQNGWELFIIADGHGIGGEWPATKVIEVLPNVLQGDSCTKMLQNEEVSAALLSAFEKTQQFLEEESPKAGVMLEMAGCAVVCAMRHPNRNFLWVASAGDSRAMLIAHGSGVIQQTNDHKPSVAEERKRIEENGGEIISENVETARVFVRGEAYPGLAMTRSLGDTIVKDFGVISEPEVVKWHLDGRPGLMLVAATDGLWDFLENDVIATHILGGIQAGRTTQKIAEELLSFSRSAWQQQTDGQYVDDITILLVPLCGASSTHPFKFAHSCGCLNGLNRLLGRRERNVNP